MMKSDPTSGRMARWLDSLHELDFSIEYKPGSKNGNADALLCQAWPATSNTKEGEGGVRSGQQTIH